MPSIDNALKNLHPLLRGKITALMQKLDVENLPFKLFEGYRSPQRQRELYSKGRSVAGKIVTNAKPWSSYHQYGLAVDFVLYINGKWSWDTNGDKGKWWDKLHELAKNIGLERLSFEKPHLQLKGLTINDLLKGNYPPDGDSDWAENLANNIYSWSGQPSAPPIPSIIPERPPLEEHLSAALSFEATASVGSEDWHNSFGGRLWRYDVKGVYTQDYKDGKEPHRTPGEPLTCRAILNTCSDEIIAASKKHQIPAAIIVMTIATETGFLRNYRFTGPKSFRWEPHVKVKDVNPHDYGDYSAGPMQTLASTARWVIKEDGLEYDPFIVAPHYITQLAAPDEHPLYDLKTNIDIGTAEIKRRWNKTGADPILVAAAYNAGGIHDASDNDWHIRSHGNHLDRAAQWYGDACAALNER
ncbi:Peptidase M15B and M15C, D,D-carboxypeptidase VanY/endolysins domain protein [Candidatus Magnetoovum chiemensis]|nr:Peptidase M15B and M15C, D,D-carboxypeptidase VanY/endolysins domain protein [Candidatus Magnetoovum chiemensis]